MKNFMKFIPVALGLLALASCSNDDFFGDSPEKVDIRANMGKGDMVVKVAETPLAGNAITRALRDFNYPTEENPNPDDPLYFFQNGDQIRVYDASVLSYDLYQYNPKLANNGNEWAFRLMSGTSNIGAPMFALYPRENIIRGFWENMDDYNHANEGSTGGTYPDYHSHGWVKVDIPCEFDYWADYPKTNKDPKYDETPVYQERVPLFGKVTSTEQGYVETTLEYLTAVLGWEATGVPEYAKWLRVRLYDPIKEEYLTIAGRFKTDLIRDNKPRIAYTTDEEGRIIVDEAKTARITYKDLLPESEYYAKDGDQYVDPCDQIIVNLDVVTGLRGEDAKHVKVFVPLVTTDEDNRKVKVIVETSMDKENWTTSWESESQVIKRGQQIRAGYETNVALKGHTICAINDILAIEAEKAEPDQTVTVNCENPIEITDECLKLLIPNKKGVNFKINMKNGVYSRQGERTLIVQYENPEDEVNVPSSVQIIAKRWINSDRRNRTFDLDARLPKSIFNLVNISLTDKEAAAANKNTLEPIKATMIDATAFILGDAENNSRLDGTSMLLSDNVTKLTVDKKSLISYGNTGNAAPYGLIIPNSTAPEGYQATNIEEIEIGGYFFGGIDAHAKTAKAINLIVGFPEEEGAAPSEEEAYAVAWGDIRVKGKIDVLKKGLIVSLGRDFFHDIDLPSGLEPIDPGQLNPGDGDGDDDEPTVIPFPTNLGGVAAAYEGVNVTGQSFILGPVFTKNKNITINNTGLDLADIVANGGKLSDVIYELYSDDIASWLVAILKTVVGYGPLYSENGSVSITAAKGSKLVINDMVNDEVAILLNDHAAETVKFTVYGKEDIDLYTTEDGTIRAYGDMWAEKDINFKGDIKASRSGDNKCKVIADHNFAMEGASFAQKVTVGRNATVSVDPQDGLCEAIDELTFVKKHDVNGLFLNEGFIRQIWVGDVATTLTHGDKAAYTAIAFVDNPDNLVADEQASIWNGQMLSKEMKEKYVPVGQGKVNLWTASELAAQADGYVTSNQLTLRSNIALGSKKGYQWPGIVTNEGYPFVFEGMNHTIKNMELNSPDNKTAGFIREAKNDVSISNLNFDNVTTNIARVPAGSVSYGTGAVIGRANKAARLERVTVKLGNGNFGSDGTNNLKSANIGGVIGAALGGAVLSGVQVDASKATLSGYHSIGGFIGKAKGNVVISKNGPTGKLNEMKPEVTGLKINVTYVTNAVDQTVNDLNQGKTGLYIGTVEFVPGKDAVEGTPAVVWTAEEIESLDDEAYVAAGSPQPGDVKTPATPGTAAVPASTVTISNAQDALTDYVINTEIDGCNLLNKVFYHLKRANEDYTYTYKYEKADQNMIGFCGKEVVNPLPIMINGESYQIKIAGNNGTTDLDKILYKLTRKKTE